jgi:hypothetical protein
LNVRGILNTLRFDRTSYVPKVVQWEPNKFWGSRYNPTGLDNINSVSSDVSLYYGRAYKDLTGTVTNPSTSAGTGAIFTVTNVLLGGTYNVALTNGGSNYGVFDTITIPGTQLSGTTPTNDCYVTVDTVNSFYSDLLQDTTTRNGSPGPGTGARFDITVKGYGKSLTGTLNVTNGSTIVTGTGTLFYSEVSSGSIVYINGVRCVVGTVPANVPSDPDFNIKLILISNYTGATGSYSAKVAVSEYVVEIDSVFYPGANYAVDDTIVITGDRLNGVHPQNDLTIRVVSVSDTDGKITSASAVTGLNYGAAVFKGSVKTYTASGVSLDSNFASLQGAVMPIQSIDNDHGVAQDASGNVIVRLDYYPSALEPGQIQGAKTYFYHNSVPYIYVGSDGTRLEVHRPRFDPDDVEQNYFIKIINGGASQHYVGEKIKISGALLGGRAKTNDVIITVSQIGDRVIDLTYGYVGVITGATCEGTSAKAFDMYYVKPVTMTQVEVFYDPGMKRPVKYIDFVYTNNNDFYEARADESLDFTPDTPGTPNDYLVEYQRHGLSNISDFAYIPEPFALGLSYRYDFNSYVTYANRIWRCIQSNNDTVFDLSKWIEIESGDRSINALDRIVAYYTPAINMPAKDLQQLVRGISYPGNVYYGNSFSPEDIIPIDVTLKGRELYPRTLDIKSIITSRELITGALSLVNGSRNVTGIGTLFNKELAYNIRLYINDVEYVVANIVNNYTMTLASNYSGPNIITTAYKFQYTAIGESSNRSLLLSSNDGITWKNHILAENSLNVTSMIYAEDKYLVSTLSKNNPMLVSYDGIAWLGQGQTTLFDTRGYDDDSFDSSPQSYPADNVTKVIHATDGFYYGIGSFITRSVDGIVWYKQYDFGTKTLNFINSISEINTNAFKGFIAVGSGNQILSGADTAAPVVTKTSVIITSLDGRVWTLQDPYLTPSALNVILSNSDIIVAAGENGKLWYSVNGFNWVEADVSGSTVTSTLNAGVYANSRFVVVGDNGTILTSTDGITWAQRTTSTLTTDKLTDVMYDGLRYYIVGSNATIIRSSNAVNWASVSLLTPAEPDSVVAGDDFLFGYGPEELVPGILTESLSIKVTTSPGSNWDNTPLIVTPDYYQNTGFGMKSIVSATRTVNFGSLFKNPAQISVFLLDSTTKLGNRMYTGYTVNWMTRVVTLNSSLPANKVLMVEAYEVGNGKISSRSNSQLTPLRIDRFTGNSEIILNQPYIPIVNTPIVYHNGVKLLYQTDYDVTFTEDFNLSKISFSTTYNQETDYISWTILDTSLSDFRTPDIGELSYSIPETETFTGSATDTFALANNLSGLNADNAIVEKNGIRLSTTDYTIDFATMTLTLTNSVLSSDVVAVTTFNETDRLFLQTLLYTATANQTLYPLPQGNTDAEKGPVYYTDVNKLWVTINGLRVSSEKLNYDINTQSFTRSTDKVKTLPNYGSGINSINILVKKNGVKLKPVTDYLIDLYAGTLTMENNVLSSDVITVSIYNNLIIDAPINNGDTVMITVTLDGNTPSETIFTINVDKYGQPNVYRSNEGDGTWLTTDFNLGDTEIHVHSVDPLVDTVVQNTTVTLINTKLIAYVECDASDVRQIAVYNQTSSSVVTNYLLEVVDARAALVFANNTQVSVDDILIVTLKSGTILELNGEKISYSHVDFSTNTISGLVRGVLGTGPTLFTAKYTEIYGITNARTLDPAYYGTIWNSSEYSVDFGDPLQVSTTPAAKFLRSGQY